MERREEVSQQQKELLTRQNELRPQVEEFDNKKAAIEVGRYHGFKISQLTL